MDLELGDLVAGHHRGDHELEGTDFEDGEGVGALAVVDEIADQQRAVARDQRRQLHRHGERMRGRRGQNVARLLVELEDDELEAGVDHGEGHDLRAARGVDRAKHRDPDRVLPGRVVGGGLDLERAGGGGQCDEQGQRNCGEAENIDSGRAGTTAWSENRVTPPGCMSSCHNSPGYRNHAPTSSISFGTLAKGLGGCHGPEHLDGQLDGPPLTSDQN